MYFGVLSGLISIAPFGQIWAQRVHLTHFSGSNFARAILVFCFSSRDIFLIAPKGQTSEQFLQSYSHFPSEKSTCTVLKSELGFFKILPLQFCTQSPQLVQFLMKSSGLFAPGGRIGRILKVLAIFLRRLCLLQKSTRPSPEQAFLLQL